MESELNSHSVSASMLCQLRDVFENRKANIDASNAKYMLRCDLNADAEITLFNREYTMITKTLKLYGLSNRKCFTFWKGKYSSINNMVACCRDKISYFRVEGEDKKESIVEKCNAKLTLEQDDDMAFLSQPIELDQRTACLVGYSRKDHFYMFIVEHANKDASIRMVKLNNIDIEPAGLFGWFKKSKIDHYNNVFLHPFPNCQSENGFKILSIRDGKVTLHWVETNYNLTKVSIRTLKQAEDKIPVQLNEGIVKNVIFSSNKDIQAEAIIAVEDNKNNVSVILVKTYLDKSSPINISLLIQSIPRLGFSMLRFHENLYFTMEADEGNGRFYMLKIGKDKLKTFEILQQQQAIFFVDERICMSGGEDKIYLILKQQILKLELNSETSEVILNQAESEQRLLDKYKAKINRLLSSKDYVQLAALFAEREAKIIVWISHKQKMNEKVDQTVRENLMEIAICSNILTSAIKSGQYQQMMNKFNLKRDNGYLRLENYQVALRDCKVKTIRVFLRDICDFEMYNLLINQILGNLYNHKFKVQARKIIQQICKQSVQHALRQLQNLPQAVLFKQMVLNVVQFYDIHDSIIASLINKYGEVQFTKNLIIKNRLGKHFINYYVQHQNKVIKFQTGNIVQMVQEMHAISKEKLFQFAEKLFKKCKEVDQKYPQFMKKNAASLVKAFRLYGEEIRPILKATFPGLLFYFHILQNTRKQGEEQICNLSKKTQISISKLMLLSIADSNPKHIKSARICEELKVQFRESPQLIDQLEEKKYISNRVNQRLWEDFKRVCLVKSAIDEKCIETY